LYRLESDTTVIDHHLYQDVLSTLAELGGEASTDEITARINTGRDGAYDRLRTLEAYGKVTQTADDRTRIWELTE
jgi:DNA-binding IclR family transcriptional regulator